MQMLAAKLLYTEAAHLDSQRWDEWLAMYLEDCEFWVPAWQSEHTYTSDPSRELSLIYYSSRSGLEDRVWRVRSGKSPASVPLPRTQHMITNVLPEQSSDTDSVLRVSSEWVTRQYATKHRSTDVLYGRYEHEFVVHQGEWRIARKKVILLNDTMPAMVDYYGL